jgi:hypothetical protein
MWSEAMIEITREGIKVRKMLEARRDKLLTCSLYGGTGTLECLHATLREALRVKAAKNRKTFIYLQHILKLESPPSCLIIVSVLKYGV